jgi:outer membrane protein
MRLVVVALALPVAVAAQVPGDESARPIRLSEAVQLAQQNAPATVQARGQIRTTSAQVRSSISQFLPSLSLNAGASRQGGDRFNSEGRLVPFSGQPWQYNHGLSLNLDLLDGGQRFYNVRAARAQVDAAASTEVSQRFQVALQVKQQYFAVLAAREAEAAAQSQLESANQQLRTASAKLAARTSTKSDSLRSVIQVGNAQLALLTAQNNVQTANASLTRLVGTPFTVTASPEDTVSEALAELDSVALAGLVEDGPGVRQAQSTQVAARASARSAKGPYLPTISLGYGITGSRSDPNFMALGGQYAYSNSLRLSLSYPIFNQFSREENVVRTAVALQNADASLRDAKLLAQQNFVQYWGALRTAEQQIAIQSASVTAAEEDLRVQKQRYELGASTLLDVLTSEANLIQARSTLIQARYNYRVAKAQLEALVGRDL